MEKIKVVELFAGVGGFRVGLNKIKNIDIISEKAIEEGDWEFVWANQWEPSTKNQPAFDCYVKRFGNENAVNEDIIKINKKYIPSHNLLVGGFPCQDYSVARSKSNEMGIEGVKGVLWWQIYETLYEKKTQFVLLENVDRLLKSPAKQRGRDFAIMLKSLSELGYIVQWRMINAGEYGMPQRRRRVFILATHKSTKYSKKILKEKNLSSYLIKDGFFNDLFPINNTLNDVKTKDLSIYVDKFEISSNYKLDKFLTSGIYIEDKVYNFDAKEITESFYTLGKVVEEAKKYNDDLMNYILNDKQKQKWEELKGSKRIQRTKPNGEIYYYSEGRMSTWDSLELPARTMLTSEGTINRSSHAIWDNGLNLPRRITEVEAELIQMFPPNWTNTGMTSRNRYFMMGNALVTGVISRIEPKLKEIILQNNKK